MVLGQAKTIPGVGVEDPAVQRPEDHAAGHCLRPFSVKGEFQIADDVLGVQRLQCLPAGHESTEYPCIVVKIETVVIHLDSATQNCLEWSE